MQLLKIHVRRQIVVHALPELLETHVQVPVFYLKHAAVTDTNIS